MNDEAPQTAARTLHVFPETLAIVRLGPGADLPPWAEASSILSVTATATETSVICAGRDVPRKVPAHRGYRAFVVAGVLDPAEVGVLHALLGPLVEERIGVMTVSTHDTDWLLVPADDAERAAEAWRRSGHTVEPAPVG
ncbi:ACT domain-containing protein [Nocardioides sp. CFH 31398]|uniref:ACT domain-containing protein n=1 Tax=Nocardioides sp. CFH 31398 TaxID=2919579 RepID=UPI001F0654B8|nr:ACT domain-containing protein [Nocardioides sp. CFH 31398]MCH1868955.1 ACT domain-containing protein [Nocardioides sp. CFH 31398]